MACHESLGDDEDDWEGFTSGEADVGGSSESGGLSRELTDVPATACEPVLGPTCDEIYAPAVRGLERGEEFAITADDGPSNLAFTHAAVTRDVPPWDHPSLSTVLIWAELEITAPLAPEASARLRTLVAATPDEPGPYGGYADATIRVGDRQACFGVGEGCPAFDELHAFALELDDALLEAWWAQDDGYLFGFETVDFEAWPLEVDWGDGGRIDVDEAAWNTLEGGWYVDAQGRHAHVGRSCTGTADGCTTWTIDVELVTVRPSPLTAEENEYLLAGQGLFPFPIAVDAEAYAVIEGAHILELPDSWVVVLVVPNPHIPTAIDTGGR